MIFFKSKKQKADEEKLSHIRALISLTLADGRINTNEIKAIYAVAAREGIDKPTVERMIEKRETVDLVIPKDEAVKERFLADMVKLVMSDGEAYAHEMSLCKLIALKFGYLPDQIDPLIARIVAQRER